MLHFVFKVYFDSIFCHTFYFDTRHAAFVLGISKITTHLIFDVISFCFPLSEKMFCVLPVSMDAVMIVLEQRGIRVTCPLVYICLFLLYLYSLHRPHIVIYHITLHFR